MTILAKLITLGQRIPQRHRATVYRVAVVAVLAAVVWGRIDQGAGQQLLDDLAQVLGVAGVVLAAANTPRTPTKGR